MYNADATRYLNMNVYEPTQFFGTEIESVDMCNRNLGGDRILCKQRDQIPSTSPSNGRDKPTFSDAILIEGDGYTPT